MYRSVVGFGCSLLCFQNYNNCTLTFSWPSSLPSSLPSPSSLNYEGPYDPTTATSMKTSLKNRLRILSLFSRLFQGAQLLKRREFGLELKRGDRARILTEMVEFIGLPFPFPSKLKIWSFHVVVMQGLQRNVQKKRDARAKLLFCLLNLLLFLCSRCRRRRSFVRSLRNELRSRGKTNKRQRRLLSVRSPFGEPVLQSFEVSS